MTPKPEDDWTAGAYVFSGRPDPTWNVTASAAAELMELRGRLPVLAHAPAPKTVLGYRGCWLERPGGPRLVARDGVVVTEGGEQAPGVREDGDHAFEQALLATAPPELLPPFVWR
jgi:hypothetical protein